MCATDITRSEDTGGRLESVFRWSSGDVAGWWGMMDMAAVGWGFELRLKHDMAADERTENHGSRG